MFSRLHMGYVLHTDGRVESVSSTDFELYDYGEDGNPPRELIINFNAGKLGKLCKPICLQISNNTNTKL